MVVAPLSFALAAIAALLAPRAVRAHSRPLRWGLTVASAVMAGLAGCQPTGTAAADAVLTGALGAFVVWVGCRARPWVVAAAAVGASVAAIASPVQVAALAAAGAMTAVALTARRAPMMSGAGALVVVQVALRLRIESPSAVSAAVAALLIAPIVVSGWRRTRSADKRAATIAAGTVLGLGLAAAGGGVAAALTARPSIEQGADAVASASSAAGRADTAAAAALLAAARDDFRRSQVQLDRWWAKPALMVPGVAQNVRAMATVSRSGRSLAHAGLRLTSEAPLDGLEVEGGRIPLSELEAIRPAFAQAAGALSAAVTDLSAARSPWLIPTAGGLFDRQVERLTRARDAAARGRLALEVLPDLLGRSGPRRYFLAVQTPVEARAAGGFIGNFGEVTADQGRLSLSRFGRLAELNEGGDPEAKVLREPREFVERYGRFAPAQTWQNVTMSPDFPTVGRVIADLYPQSGGTQIDGVIAIDPAGIAAMLRLTGPIAVKGWPQPLTTENVERVLQYEQYVALESPARVELLGQAAETAWGRLTTMTLPPLPTVLNALGPAVAGRHIQFSVADASRAAALNRLGVDGAFPPVDGDFFSVVTQNASGSKIEWFLRRAVDYRVRIRSGRIAVRARVDLRNEAPPDGLPDYLIGNTLGLPRGTTRLYVSIYSPWALSGARLDGRPLNMESERELGRWVYSAYVDIGPGGSARIELDLEGGWSDESDYSLGVHHQPTVTPDRLTLDVDGRRRAWSIDRDHRLAVSGR